MATKAKMNPKEVRDPQFEQRAQLKAIEEKIYQTMEVSSFLSQRADNFTEVERMKKKMTGLEEFVKEETDKYVVATMNLERKLEAKTVECERLTAELGATNKHYEDKLVALAAHKDEEIANLKSEIYNVKFEMHKKVSELNEELRSLKDFKDRQEEYYGTMDQLKNKCDDLTHTHHDDLKRIDNQNKKAIQKLVEKFEKDVSQIEHDAKKKVEHEVEISERKVIEDNKKLQADLINYKKEVDALKKEKEAAIDQNKQIKQNISLQEDGVLEYQAIHFRQENKIRKLKEKVQVLKNYIAQEVTKHTKEIESSRYQSQVKIGELEIQNQTMREELKLKMKEAKNLKALSQIILDQRSEIEEFLLETLDHVKEEVKRQKNSEKKTRLPEIQSSRGKLDSQTKPKKNWDKIDFTSIDWEDKEKILRILFSKMNTGLLPSNWRTASFEKSSDVTAQSMNGGINIQQHSTL